MFKNLTKNLNAIFDKMKGTGVLTEEQIDSAMRDIRIALLEADVALPAVREFINNVREKAKGQNIVNSISPSQMVIKIIHDEMISFLAPGETENQLNLTSNPPANLLIVGLQGSGKTTASAKLALYLKKKGKKVLLVSLDVYRPAAQEQLETLAKDITVDSLPIISKESPKEITNRALLESKLGGYDIVIYDSAGRLHIDQEMIQEVMDIKYMVKPTETMLVVDSMIGQDAANIAKVFDQKLSISAVILSRIDGDSRGGAALSVRHVTGKPIKFLSTGEKPNDLELFDAKRITSRILGMGDIVSLVEKAADVLDQKKEEKSAARLKKGIFDLNDYIKQIKTIKKLGGIGNMMGMIPGISKLTNKVKNNVIGDEILVAQEAIVLSMTKKERRSPKILNASRKKRIASGAGATVPQVNTLIKQFDQISGMMKKVSKMDQKSLMRGGLGKLFS